MADLYVTIAEQPDAVLDSIAASLDKRAAEPAMRAICARYLSALPQGANALEIGCGNGASTAMVRDCAAPRRLTCIDPSQGLLDRARPRFPDPEVTLAIGDAVNTGQSDAAFDLVIAHTVFSHLPDPEAALSEAFRVLRPGGTLAVFDGDYATNTVALFDGDPLQAAMQAVQRHLIHDPYIMRRLPGLMDAAGFTQAGSEAHGYTQTDAPDYLQSLIARGLDAAMAAGEIGAGLAEGFLAECRSRVAQGRFYGAILFVSTTAVKPL